MERRDFCNECEMDQIDDDLKSSFTYVGNGDWKCPNGHLMHPDAFGRLLEGVASEGAVHADLVDDTVIEAWVSAYDHIGVVFRSVQWRDKELRSWIHVMDRFIPWARIAHVRELSEREDKEYHQRFKQ